MNTKLWKIGLLLVVAFFLCTVVSCGKDDEPQLPTSTTQTEPGPVEEPDSTDSGDTDYTTVTVNLEKAGDLESLIDDNRSSIFSLKISGPLNGDDIYYLRRLFGSENLHGSLRYLDLKEASIVEGGRSYSSSSSLYTSKDKIGVSMFSRSSILISLVLPDNVTTIEKYAFYMSSISQITIGPGVTSIESSAFYWCRSMGSIEIPDNVTSIGDDILAECISLRSVTIGQGVTTIPSSAFQSCSNLNNVILSDNVTTIESSAFFGCSSLSNINIPNSVTSIGGSAFYSCRSLSSIELPDNVTSIGSSIFYNCTALKDVTLSQGLTSIPRRAFAKCTSLKSIIIPENVTTIGQEAFAECTYLNELYCYATTPPSIDSSFDKPNIFIYVPKGCLEIYQESAWGEYFSYIYEMD